MIGILWMQESCPIGSFIEKKMKNVNLLNAPWPQLATRGFIALWQLETKKRKEMMLAITLSVWLSEGEPDADINIH